jgi:hypothetical protein
MAVKIQKLDVWVAEISDEVGGLAKVLEPLAAARADLAFVIARRRPEMPGTGIVFLAGLKGAKQTKAAAAAGLVKTSDLVAARVEVTNKPGLLNRFIEKLASAGISLRGVSASVTGTKCVIVLAFDTAVDCDKAVKLLRK